MHLIFIQAFYLSQNLTKITGFSKSQGTIISNLVETVGKLVVPPLKKKKLKIKLKNSPNKSNPKP